MGSLAFLQPWFLVGLAGAAVPLVIHLINRQRRRRVAFSAVRFLVQTDRRSARKYRLVDLLVLLLRMLLLALVALALAQPILRPPNADAVAFGRISLTIILDDTLSMQANTDGLSAFDRAKDAAASILTEMPQDAEARVILISGNNPSSLATAASPPSIIADAVADLKPSYSSRAMNEAFSRALDHLAGSKPRHKSLTVITDNQASTLRDLKSVDMERLEETVLSMHWIDVGESSENMAVISLQASPRTCFPGTPVRLVTRVLNASANTQLTNASLWIDGIKVSDAPVESSPLSANEVVFEHVPQTTGLQQIEVRIEPDALGVDNSRFSQLRVLETVSALLIIPDGLEGDRESLYLKTALNPLASPNYSGRSPVLVRTETYATARHATLETYKIVFAVDNGNMPGLISNAIYRYTDAGGTAVVFPGIGWLEENNPNSQAGNPRIGNVNVSGLWQREAGESTHGIGQYNSSHPIFSLLSRAAPQLFNMVTVESHLQFDERSLNPYAQVAARLTSGEPLLVDTRTNKGRLLLWSIGPTPEWTDLPLRPLFLPMLYETLKFASDTEARIQDQVLVDESLDIEMPPPTADIHYTVETPDGKRETMILETGQSELHYPEQLKPGHYVVYPVENISDKRMVSVNVHPDESRPGKISDETLQEWFGEQGLVLAASAREVSQLLTWASKGFNLTGILLVLALVVFLLENFLANLFLRHGEQGEKKKVKRVQRLFHRFRAIDTGS